MNIDNLLLREIYFCFENKVLPFTHYSKIEQKKLSKELLIKYNHFYEFNDRFHTTYLNTNYNDFLRTNDEYLILELQKLKFE